MTNQYDYSKYLQDSEVTAKESYRIKDGGGGKGILIPEMVENIPQFQPSLGVKVMDIIMSPAGSRHPLVVAGKMPQGTMTHITWVFIHKSVGTDWWVCPARTFHQRCPFCEHRAKLQADPNIPKETYNLYGTGKYATGIYKMVHHLNPNQITWQEPVMVWVINNSFMETPLQSMAKQPMVTPEAPTGYINYMWPTAGPQGGRHIKVEIKPKGQYFDYEGHQFLVRQAPVPGHIMDAALAMPPLDELVYVPTYDEMKDALEIGLEQPVGGAPTGETYAPAYQAPAWEQPAPVLGMPQQDACPYSDYDGVLGQTYGKFEECQACQLAAQCKPAQQVQAPAPTVQRPPAPAPAQGAPIPPRPPLPTRPQR